MQMLAQMVQPRVTFAFQAAEMLDFVDQLPTYDIELYNHKKMKSNAETSVKALELAMHAVKDVESADWNNDFIYTLLADVAEKNELKNGQVLWPVRTALSGKATTPCGASELAVLLGKEETVARIMKGIEKLSV